MALTTPRPRQTLRRRVRWGIYHLARWTVLGAGFLHLPFGVRVVGRRNVPLDGPILMVANHLHNFDILVIDAAVRRPLFWMAKQELFENELFGRFITMLGAFPVKREGVDRWAIRHAGLLLDEGLAVGMLPEGTRSPTRALQQGNPGAALVALSRNVPIVPIGVSGTEHLPLDKNSTGERWFARRTTVTIGKPFTLPPTPPGAKADLRGATERIMLEIAALLPPDYRGVYAEKFAAWQATGQLPEPRSKA